MGHVPPFDDEDDHGGVEEIAVEVVENKQPLFPFIAEFLVDVRFVNPTGYGAGKERAIVKRLIFFHL